ncbi:nitrogen fixation protein FixB [Escherichia coli]|uniref:FAD-binding protein n=1 Tax=Escherichia coli TaxID=562 RepID=UPI00092ACBED|nr:FAD-binding protein [Escherichia coli]OJR24902.1 nitrogen fixation protein FixB [Escherichia coli]
MNTFSQVWVFSDTPSRLPELMNGAQALANQINTFVLNDADGAQAIQLGANHVWKLNGKPDDRMIEDYAGVMADTIRQHGADGLVLLPNTRRGKLLAAKLGYRLKAAVSNDASTVSVGRGIGSKENIALAEQLCKAIGAELACSRPVAENEKWMEHERYVGISNLMLKPELYLAVGISGQIQHMVGANASQTIFAINKDKNAPIFQYADYGIVGDAVKILPALTAALAR